MFRIDGIDGESIVVDGIWVEKLRTNTSLDALVAELEKAWERASSERGLGSELVDDWSALAGVLGLRDQTGGAQVVQFLQALGNRLGRWRSTRAL